MKVNKVKSYLFGFLILTMMLAGKVAYGKETDSEISIGKEFVFDSAILKEKRTIQIALPSSYSMNHKYTRYPVLYLLDGQMFFHSVTGTVQHLSSDASRTYPR